MSDRVVVLGAGYAGCTAIRTLERRLDDADLVWVSDTDRHLVLHEVHRAIRHPAVREDITVPIADVKEQRTTFVEGRVDGLDPEDRRVELADGDEVDYDYLLVALGSQTAFYGIPGLAEHAHTLKSLEDATAIHEAVRGAANGTTPARVLVGGAGLSGVQTAGEVAALRDEMDLSIEVVLVEALPQILPQTVEPVRDRVRGLLAERDVEVLTDDPITEVDGEAVHFEERAETDYDVLVWTGGITGRDALVDCPIEHDHERLVADSTFETSDDRVFAVGDSALVGLDGDTAPPTAQAAWDAAEVAASNVINAIEGRPKQHWTYRDKGTLISVGESAVAHDVAYLPAGTFGGPLARFLKKLVAARWIASIASWPRGLAAWDSL